MAEDMSPGEVGRSLGRLETGIQNINSRLDALSAVYVRRDVAEATMVRITEEVVRAHDRIDGIETRTSTNFRWAIGSFISPVVVAIVVALIFAVMNRA